MFQSNYYLIEQSGYSFDPGLLQNIGLGLLTILVPIAVAVLTEYFKKNVKGDAYSKFHLDNFFTQHFNLVYLVFVCGLIFVPPLIMRESLLVNATALFIWLVGVIMMIRLLYNLGDYLVSDKQEEIIESIRECDDPIKIKELLQALWTGNETSDKYKNNKLTDDLEERFIDSFFTLLEKSPDFREEQNSALREGFRSFQSNLSSRSYFNIFDNKFIERLFDLHYKLYTKSYSLNYEQKGFEVHGDKYQLLHDLESYFDQLWHRSLNDDSFGKTGSYTFLSQLADHGKKQFNFKLVLDSGKTSRGDVFYGKEEFPIPKHFFDSMLKTEVRYNMKYEVSNVFLISANSYKDSLYIRSLYFNLTSWLQGKLRNKMHGDKPLDVLEVFGNCFYGVDNTMVLYFSLLYTGGYSSVSLESLIRGPHLAVPFQSLPIDAVSDDFVKMQDRIIEANKILENNTIELLRLIVEEHKIDRRVFEWHRASLEKIQIDENNEDQKEIESQIEYYLDLFVKEL